MTTTRWIILIVWLLYAVLLIRFCSEDYAVACCGALPGNAATDQPTDAPTNPYALAFRGGSAIPLTGVQIDSLIGSINAGKTDQNILEITGFYFESERAPDGFQTMGFARAENIRKRFFGDLPEGRYRLRSRLLEGDPPTDNPYFEGSAFAWEAPEDRVDDTVEILDDRILIRFPYNSTVKDYDAEVDAYLNRLARQIRESGERVQLTGHTDNIGSDEFNQELGMRRAEAIQQILRDLGVPQEQITVRSRGKTDPVDTNDTEEGRHNNRRVEVRLLGDA